MLNLSDKKVLRRSAAFLALLSSFNVAGADTVKVDSSSPMIKIDGSSTVFPITDAVVEDFRKEKRGAVKVTHGISGTGGGFKRFCRDAIDIVNASRPILQQEMDDCKKAGVQYVEMPIALDAVTVVINPKNNWSKTITAAELKKIWEPEAQKKITRWIQVNPAWPDEPLTLYGPGADSGTFDYFTEAIVGKAKASRGDFTPSEDDDVLVEGVARDKSGLGYFGFAYYIRNQKKLNLVAIDSGKGGVLPSGKTVGDGSYTPLSRPIFIYVNIKSAEKPEVRQFIEFYMKNAPELVKETRLFPLPAQAYATNLDHLDNKKLGTVFDGPRDVGLRIEEVLKREARL